MDESGSAGQITGQDGIAQVVEARTGIPGKVQEWFPAVQGWDEEGQCGWS